MHFSMESYFVPVTNRGFAMAHKRLKNNTSESRTWVGQTIEPGEYYTLLHSEQDAWADDPQVIASVQASELVVNNTFEDILDIPAAVDYLEGTKRIAFTLSTKPLGDSATSNSFVVVASYLWSKKRGYNYVNGICVFDAVTVGDRTLEIRIVDITNGNTVIGSMIVSTPGFYSFPVTKPVGDARLELQIRKSASGGVSPVIRGAALEYDLI